MREGEQQVFWCNPQGSYRHGAKMCTTACMQVGMAALCGQLDLQAAQRAASREDDVAGRTAFVDMLNWCMNAGSTVHGRIETNLGRREANNSSSITTIDGGCNSRSITVDNSCSSRMISLNELITVLGINLDALGVGLDELVLCKQGAGTRLLVKKRRTGKGLKYGPESCFISLSHLPMCMEPASSSGGMKNSTCVALVTANGHTVCAMCYNGGEYALFDPMPGQMWVGMSGGQMASKLQHMLSMPSSVRGGGVGSVCLVAEEEGGKKRRNNKAKRRQDEDEEEKWQDCGDGVQFWFRSKMHCGDKDGGGGEVEEGFYADVTLLHMR